jgi:hypothetical protein
MRYSVSIQENRLITKTCDVTFETAINRVVYYHGCYIVQLGLSGNRKGGDVLGTIFDNVYCVNSKGKQLWRIWVKDGVLPTGTQRIEVSTIYMEEKKPLTGFILGIGSIVIDIKTGEITKLIPLEGNKLVTPNFEMAFENLISEEIHHQNNYYILVSVSSKKNCGYAYMNIVDNVYCVDESGNMIWRVKSKKEGYTPVMRGFVSLKLMEDGNLKGDTFSGVPFIIDAKTGEILKQLPGERF